MFVVGGLLFFFTNYKILDFETLSVFPKHSIDFQNFQERIQKEKQSETELTASILKKDPKHKRISKNVL